MPAKSGLADPLPAGQSNRVTPGQLWKNRYQVEDSVGEPAGRWFKARDTEERSEVLLRVTNANGSAGRTGVWQRIRDSSPPHVQRPLAVHEAGERVEVWAAPRGQSLRSWRSSIGPPDKERLLPVIRQLTAAIESLHFAGVGHFSLNPDSVYVHEDGAGLVVTLGGFETAILNEGSELIAVAVDPFTSPPEAAGLFQHSPGELLRGWDWWSLGRLLQEVLLGHHVIEDVPEGQITRTLPASAAVLLTEREIPGVRAGAVEVMPELDQSLARLLRGLLTTAVTGRWSALEIKEWLAGGTPPERYAAARHEEFFRFQGRGYTVPEFARVLQGGPVEEAVRHLFAPEQKDTLAYFLHESSAHAESEERLNAARELAGAVALRQLAEPLRREIAAAVAWQGLARGAFVWRGQALSDTKLREQVESAGEFRQWRTALLALATPLVLNYLNVHDAEAVRLLERLVKTAGEAEEMAVRSRWLKPDSPAAQALWVAALEPEAKLAAAQEKLHAEYAASDDAAFQAVFTAQKPTRVMQVLIAWAAADPRTFRLVTPEEMRQRRQKALVGEAESLARIIFWLRLDQAMRAGPWLFGGRWFLIGAGLVIVSLLAVHVPGPWGVALGLLPLLVLAGARLAINRWQAGLVSIWSPESAPWDWRAGPSRSAEEVQALAAKQGGPSTLSAARAARQRVADELRKLAADNQSALVPPQAPRHTATWSVVGFGWLVVLGLAAGSIIWGLAHPPSWTAHVTAWQKTTEKEKPAKPVETGKIKITWPYKVSQDAYEVAVKGAFTPTSEQAAEAIRHGKALVAPYKPETISSLVAIYVPLEKGRGGLLLFDGRKGALLGRGGVIIDFVPFPRTALQVGDQLAFFVEH